MFIKELMPGFLAYRQIEEAAEEIRKREPNLTKDEAIDRVYTTRPVLVKHYREEYARDVNRIR
jgi:hypothetical protein